MKRILSNYLIISMILDLCVFTAFAEGIDAVAVTDQEVVSSTSNIIISTDEVIDEDIEKDIVENAIIEESEEFIVASSSEMETEDVLKENSSEIKFQDDTFLEINEEMNYGLILPDFKAPLAKKDFKKKLFGVSPLPSSKDMRDEKNANNFPILPDVRNQGSEGLCWAFSTIGMIEISLRKQGIINTEPNDENSNLSEAALGYFVLDGLCDITADGSVNIDKPGLEGNDYTKRKDLSNKGGNQFEASIIGSSYMGMVSEDDNTRYDNVNNIFNGSIDISEYAFNKNAYEIKNVQFINYDDRDIIKQAIMDHGSVGINYRANDGTTYKTEWNGKSEECFYFTGRTPNYDTKQYMPNHSVLIVGWDDNIPKTYFSRFGNNPDHDGAWLIRNSWGSAASNTNGGYFWMSYDEKTIDDTLYSIEAMKADTYQYNYHYDTSGIEYHFDGSITDTNPTHFALANVFHVSSDCEQTLDAVNIAVNDVGAKFEIRVYTKDTSMSNPTDGILQSAAITTTDVFDTAGIYTIPLAEQVFLARNTYYSIVVKALTDTTRVMIDKSVTDSDRIYVNVSEMGQSFWGTDSLTNWRDFNEGELSSTDNEGDNFRIKGLTNKALSIYFNGNGSNKYMSPQHVAAGENVKIKKNIFTRSGYTFDGWNTRADGTGIDYRDEDFITIVDDSVELYAKWKTSEKSSPIHTSGGGGNTGGGGGSGGGRGGVLPANQATTTLGGGPGNVVNATSITVPMSVVPINFNTASSTWSLDEKGNWHLSSIGTNGEMIEERNSFACITSVIVDTQGITTQVNDIYYFDADGKMYTGWLKDANGVTYFFEMSGAEIGKQAHGWRNIGGIYYYFSQDGSLFKGGLTPDGYMVDAEGKWVNN